VWLEMMQPIEGRKRFAGRLLGVGERDITLELESGRISLPIDDIHRARLAPDM
jgi:ribosome maturation factor RimP